MSTKTNRPASPVDYAEYLMFEKVPSQIRPYVMARLAIDLFKNGYKENNLPWLALISLKEANDDGILQPPLEAELATEIDVMVDEVNSGRPAVNQATKILLAWALSNESREG